MDEEIKYMDVKEFREFGYLQELNRQFLHPLGLALAIFIDEDSGEEYIGGVWDCREHSEGVLFNEGILNQKKIDRVDSELAKRGEARFNILGYIVQRPEDKVPEE